MSLNKKLFSLNYRFLMNDTVVTFVTSDSPFLNCVNYLLIPISKSYALQFNTAEHSVNDNIGATRGLNQGLHLITDSYEVRHINRCTREAADRYVYAALKDAF